MWSVKAIMTQEIGHIACLGGGHGLFNTLRSAREIGEHVSAIVTVADDGGSSGRIRRELGTLPPGDLRMALAALARDNERGHMWEEALQHRFGGNGALKGHALGNFLITGLAQVMGSELAALDEIARLLCVRGRVIPMSPEPLDLEAEVLGLEQDPREVVAVRGQVAVASTFGEVRRVRLIPDRPEASPEAVEAIMQADLVTMGPGSWFSSVIPHILVPGIVDALNTTKAPKALILNLVPEPGETEGLSLEHHIHMFRQHCQDLNIDAVLVDASTMPRASTRRYLERAVQQLGATVVYRDVREDDNRGRWTDRHNPAKLAQALLDIAKHNDETDSNAGRDH
ncbi:MAG TPA: uridine diphosphate-N-acetylglucosamine-binding protein YvcK [Candidatus Corynebacterium gallistercoris]|uniref:Putative gluconeogenesis factor n=1 Tax=Candidatus Corynebacterium gallistercoris TaxID=2838530 RepID=A0A9D1URK2_9CORY|nr:uridine diphosphate-N-acetylglucosamine-binding protein YvcK [Candidatus Corynebacterium gallistercoris]